MLYSVRGTLIHMEPRVAVVECGGVGFRCHITMNTARELPKVGDEATLYTIMSVREDAIELFGFADQAELECFRQLTSISGVGPKAAIAVLSELSAPNSPPSEQAHSSSAVRSRRLQSLFIRMFPSLCHSSALAVSCMETMISRLPLRQRSASRNSFSLRSSARRTR